MSATVAPVPTWTPAVGPRSAATATEGAVPALASPLETSVLSSWLPPDSVSPCTLPPAPRHSQRGEPSHLRLQGSLCSCFQARILVRDGCAWVRGWLRFGLEFAFPGVLGSAASVLRDRCVRYLFQKAPSPTNQQANQMHAIVPYPMIRGFVHILHEGTVYEISRFLLILPRSILRPVEADYAIILGASAVVKRDESNIDDFPSWSCCLTSIAELPLPDETPERFVDVLGKVSAISDVVEFKSFGRMLGVARRDVYIRRELQKSTTIRRQMMVGKTGLRLHFEGMLLIDSAEELSDSLDRLNQL